MLEIVIHQFHQQSRMYRAAIADVPAADWTRIPAERMNPLAFLAVHLFDVRYYISKFVGHPLDNPLPEEIHKARSAAEIVNWPSSESLLQGWTAVDLPLEQRLAQLDAAWIEEPMQSRIPWGIASRRDMLAFFAHHEGYHLGQMGSLRTALGLPDLMSRLLV